MKKITQIPLIVLLFSAVACDFEQTSSVSELDQIADHSSTGIDEPSYTSDSEMQNLFDSGISDAQVMIKGKVIKTLADDNEGSRHQKFIVEILSGQTILVSHNIGLASRIDDLSEGDEIKVYGEYVWNDRGGVIHWTHHDPDGEHIGGWLEHKNAFYD
jgi:hypothetical protein